MVITRLIKSDLVIRNYFGMLNGFCIHMARHGTQHCAVRLTARLTSVTSTIASMQPNKAFCWNNAAL